jgi:uncharacterized membrane protein
MNAAQLHITLNHLPVIGLVFSLAILLIGCSLRSETTQRVGLWMLLATALLAIPAFLTGEPAEDIAVKFPGVEKAFIEEHEDAAGMALGSAIAAGLAAVVVLFVSRKRTIPAWGLVTALALALVSAGVMAWTAHLGGLIRHPEIRSAMAPPTGEVSTSHAG